MKLRINPLGVAGLKAIRDYIAEDNAEAARKRVDPIYKNFENLQQFPTLGADLSKRVSFKTVYKYFVPIKELDCWSILCIIFAWQHFGNRKSVSQNKMCNRDKIKAVYTQELNRYV